ncbi:MAG: FHA domain-containing protein [Pseudomonadota bacterium]
MSTEKTSWVFDDETTKDDLPNLDAPTDATQDFGSEPTIDLTQVSSSAGSDDEATVIGGQGFSEKTVIYSPANEEDVRASATDEFDDGIDPVVGWLVVLKGPGKGRSLTLGHGMNLIGRGANQRVSMNFGDTLISSEDHAKIMYEDGEFYISHGSGKNLTRLNGKIIPNMVELPTHSLIQLSKNTTVAFVALCDKNFDWSKV